MKTKKQSAKAQTDPRPDNAAERAVARWAKEAMQGDKDADRQQAIIILLQTILDAEPADQNDLLAIARDIALEHAYELRSYLAGLLLESQRGPND